MAKYLGMNNAMNIGYLISHNNNWL